MHGLNEKIMESVAVLTKANKRSSFTSGMASEQLDIELKDAKVIIGTLIGHGVIEPEIVDKQPNGRHRMSAHSCRETKVVYGNTQR